MQKKKQSKKRWAWTEAQKRKHHPFNNWNSSAPKWYRKEFVISNKHSVKQYLRKIEKGYDLEYLECRVKYHKRCANWFWW